MPYPPKDGGSIATLVLAEALQKCGNKVDVLSMNTSKHFVNLEDLPKELTDRIKFHAVEVNTAITVPALINNLLFSKEPYNAARFISEKFNEQLKKHLQYEQYDIVQLEGLYLCPYIDTIRNYSNAKIALRSHNIEHEIWYRAASNETNLLKKQYKKLLSKRIKNFKQSYLNKYDFLVPITQRDGDQYNKLGNTQASHTVPTGIDKENYDITNSEPRFPGIFHIGALDWLPNQEGLKWFIENVWKRFKMEHPDFRFHLAGRNAPPAFENFLNSDSIAYIGEVEDANQFINDNSIMIVPILSGSGMRIKIIEGMALGKTIITTSIGTEGIDSTHNENILIADTPEDFYNCLVKVSNNKELHEKISKNAIKFVYKNFDNLKIAKGLTKFYKEENK